MNRVEMAKALGMKTTRTGHLTKAVDRLRQLKFFELTIPEKPRSKNPKMRITQKKQSWLKQAGQGDV